MNWYELVCMNQYAPHIPRILLGGMAKKKRNPPRRGPVKDCRRGGGRGLPGLAGIDPEDLDEAPEGGPSGALDGMPGPY